MLKNTYHRFGAIAKCFEVLIGADLSLDESSFEISVNNTRCLRSTGSCRDRPAANFGVTSSEEILHREITITTI